MRRWQGAFLGGVETVRDGADLLRGRAFVRDIRKDIVGRSVPGPPLFRQRAELSATPLAGSRQPSGGRSTAGEARHGRGNLVCRRRNRRRRTPTTPTTTHRTGLSLCRSFPG
jgi:hypothetical protein